ncbi:hypothetical protein Tco_1164745, partial [Tanacetum coccineum]
RDKHRTTQKSGICSPGEKDGEMYNGQLEEILEFSYMSFKVVLFRAYGEAFKNDQYILATQVKQVFYLEDMARRPSDWKVVQDVNHKKFLNWGIIVVEDDHDVIHFDNSYDLALSTSLNWGISGDDRPPLPMGGRKPNTRGRKAGRLGNREETRNLGLRKITDV